MNAITFFIKLHRWPRHDDLRRVNCKHAGEVGHLFCGWCKKHDRPRFECTCGPETEPDDEPGYSDLLFYDFVRR